MLPHIARADPPCRPASGRNPPRGCCRSAIASAAASSEVISHAQARAARWASLSIETRQLDAAATETFVSDCMKGRQLLDRIFPRQDGGDIVRGRAKRNSADALRRDKQRGKFGNKAGRLDQGGLPRGRRCGTRGASGRTPRRSFPRAAATVRSRSERGSRIDRTPSSSPSSRATSVEPTWPIWKIQRASSRGIPAAAASGLVERSKRGFRDRAAACGHRESWRRDRRLRPCVRAGSAGLADQSPAPANGHRGQGSPARHANSFVGH